MIDWIPPTASDAVYLSSTLTSGDGISVNTGPDITLTGGTVYTNAATVLGETGDL